MLVFFHFAFFTTYRRLSNISNLSWKPFEIIIEKKWEGRVKKFKRNGDQSVMFRDQMNSAPCVFARTKNTRLWTSDCIVPLSSSAVMHRRTIGYPRRPLELFRSTREPFYHTSVRVGIPRKYKWHVRWDIPYGIQRVCCKTSIPFYHAIENSDQHHQCDIVAAYDGNFGCHIGE